jgi:hypothetical protein
MLALGSAVGVLGYYLDFKTGTQPTIWKWGIASRDWVALGLLGMAGVVAAADQAAGIGSFRDRATALKEQEAMRGQVVRTENELKKAGSPSAPEVIDLAKTGKGSTDAASRPNQPSSPTVIDMAGKNGNISSPSNTPPQDFGHTIPGRNHVRN